MQHIKRIFALFLFVSTNLVGQDLSQELETVEVTATRITTPIAETGRSITVLTQKEISDLPVQTIDELLRYIPGINLNSRMGFGVQTDIGMRGSTFSQVLVLLDNVRINDPLTAHFNNNIPVALTEIERVEIVRGPAAAAYGADAVGGLIHIKTRTYLEKELDQTAQLDASIGIGEHALSLFDGGIYGQVKDLSFSLSVKSNYSDGEEYNNPSFPDPNPVDSTFNNYFDLVSYSGALNFHISDEWNAYARVSYDRRDFAAKYFYTQNTYDESAEETNSLLAQIALQRKNEKSNSELTFGYKEADDLFIFNPLFTPNSHTTKLVFGNLNHQFFINSQTKLALGSQYQLRDIVSSDRGDHRNSSIGVYGILSHPFGNKIQSSTSLRLEYDDNFGVELLPQFSLAYDLESAVVRGSIGRSIRAADFTERYISTLIADLPGRRNIGNPDLEAETAWSIDLGLDKYGSNGTFVSIGIFYRFANNLIDYALTNSNEINNQSNLLPDTDYFYTKNISKSNTYGIELALEKIFELGQESSLQFQGSATYLKTTNKDSVVSKYLANHPNLSLGLNLVFDSPSFQVSSSTSYINRDDEQVELINALVKDNYSTTHLKALVKFPRAKINIFGQVYNLFDEEYQEILGAPMPRRWLLGGIEMSISAGKKR